MRPFAWFLLGALTGVVGTVMVFTLDPLFRGDERDTSGGGNVRLVLDPEATSRLFTLAAGDVVTPRSARPSVSVVATIRTSGYLDLELELREGAEPREAGVVRLDPEIVDGRLVFRVEGERLPEAVDAQAFAERAADGLGAWLDVLATGRAYRVVSIATADGRLAIEIAFED